MNQWIFFGFQERREEHFSPKVNSLIIQQNSNLHFQRTIFYTYSCLVIQHSAPGQITKTRKCYTICGILASLHEKQKISDIYTCVCVSRSVVSNSLQPHGLQPSRVLCPRAFPGKNTGVGYHYLLQGIFPTQESNPGLLPCRLIPYHLSSQGSPIPVRYKLSTIILQHYY